MMKTENAKQAVSDYFVGKNLKVLDIFFKIPCDDCETIKTWDKFIPLPDLLIIDGEEKYFAFIITRIEELQIIKKFKEDNPDFFKYKVFLVENKELFGIKSDGEGVSKEFISNSLDIKQNKEIGSSQRTFKSMEGKWEENRSFGLLGEEKVLGLLKKMGAKVIDLNYNSPCDVCSNIQNWRKYNKLPDGIVKQDGEIFFFDAKAKSSRYFRVNERDYIKYQKKLEFLPVKIYFVLFNYDKKTVKEIYVHNVSADKKEAVKEKEWDKNKTVDVSDELEQIF